LDEHLVGLEGVNSLTQVYRQALGIGGVRVIGRRTEGQLSIDACDSAVKLGGHVQVGLRRGFADSVLQVGASVLGRAD
jgi:hypothetical protein